MFWMNMVQMAGNVIPKSTAGIKMVIAAIFKDWTFPHRGFRGVIWNKGNIRRPYDTVHFEAAVSMIRVKGPVKIRR
jgi:hypothetical protein